ncbi:MAG: hypothetical protein KF779_04450 [Hyphomonadaceae bacterium]|nr:hypothetical protein [Hyphomonadaceae bacterium]
MRVPREIRTGAAESVIERVESTVDRAEVLSAVQTLVTAAPLCYPWPGLWLAASERRNVYYARYDLMRRDWGEEVSSASQQRMHEFVELGFLTERERPDIGPGVIEYNPTPEGAAFLQGSPYGGARPQFCPNSQRRVVEITSMEFGQFDCGSLRVRFTHIADAWPTWALTEDARERIDATWAPIGVPLSGEVTLGRQWFRRGAVPPGVENGALRSLCLDGAHNVVGDDLNLNAQ